MSIMIQPDILAICESKSGDVQKQFDVTNPANVQSRALDDKPALLVVTDATDNILLSIVGHTAWHSHDVKLQGHDVALTYRNTSGTAETAFTALTLKPRIPALSFTPTANFAEKIRQSGTAAKAYLIVDHMELYSRLAVDDATNPWPVAYWDGSVALDVASLPETLPYLQLSVGDLSTDASVRLTRLDLNMAEHSVQMADPVIYLYFPNILRDWSTAKDELTALLMDVTHVGTDQADIEAKELVAFPPEEPAV